MVVRVSSPVASISMVPSPKPTCHSAPFSALVVAFDVTSPGSRTPTRTWMMRLSASPSCASISSTL